MFFIRLYNVDGKLISHRYSFVRCNPQMTIANEIRNYQRVEWCDRKKDTEWKRISHSYSCILKKKSTTKGAHIKKSFRKEYFCHLKIQCILLFFIKAFEKKKYNWNISANIHQMGTKFFFLSRVLSVSYFSFFPQIFGELCASKEKLWTNEITLSRSVSSSFSARLRRWLLSCSIA